MWFKTNASKKGGQNNIGIALIIQGYDAQIIG
jgi:hypothetical protein